MKIEGVNGRAVINFGLAAVVILLILALIASLYEMVTGNKTAANFIRNPEIVALAIGLILTVLFVDRWRALEGKIDGLSKDQRDRLQDIQNFSKEHIELKVDQAISKAEKVSAKLAGLSEQHPWLQVITDRDILVETESVRGILRSSYMLLRDERPLHLYEFLEYCSRKGTSEDPRERKLKLRGTADDFFEVASFCETWLEDYALGAQFLKRFIEQTDGAAYVAYPDYARRLLRIGSLPAAKRYTDDIERIMRRDRWCKLVPVLPNATPISDRYRWHAANTLSLAHAAFGDLKASGRYAAEAIVSPYALVFGNQQLLFKAERQIYLGDVEGALQSLDGIDRAAATSFDLRDEVMLRERLGLNCAQLRETLRERQAFAFGDHGDGEAKQEGADTAPRGNGGAPKNERAHATSKGQTNGRGPSRKPKTKRETPGPDVGPAR